jgi:GNAT superfamily N-acetyltransferase
MRHGAAQSRGAAYLLGAVRGIEYRPMRDDELPEVVGMNLETFDELERRLLHPGAPRHDAPRRPPEPIDRHVLRLRRCLVTDPAGCWVAIRAGRVVGCAIAILREGLWGLSLLVVHPTAQSGGVGRELLRIAWEYGAGASGHVILSSRDARAVRAYARLGLALHPSIAAAGIPRGVTAADGVLREGGRGDLPLTEAIDREVRGAVHGEDVLAMIDAGHRLLVLPDRGYALVRDGVVRLLAAFDDESARVLLRAILAEAARTRAFALVEWITAAQNWAVDVCVEAGLELQTAAGAVFLGGDVGRFRPYMPSGAYL